MDSLFFKINSWDDFNEALEPLNTKQKGDAFELLTKAYFEIDHKYNNYDNIWLLSEVPKKDLEIIGLESRDLGVDLIAKKGSEYHAIQCKYHTDKDRSVSFREVSTFLSNLGGYDKLTEGYLCSSAVSTTKNYDDVKKKPVSKILHDTWSNLDEEFFGRVKKYLKKEKYSPSPYYPRPHQEKATNQAYEHFIKNKEPRGKLIFPCGAGKSLTGFWMMEKLDAMSTVIAVPSLSLVKQTLDVYLKEIVARDIKVNWLCICSDEGIGSNTEIKFKTEDIGVPCKTDPEYIKAWLKEHKNSRNIIFTTYQSSRLIADISKELNHTFDLGILDEAHKTVGGNDKLFSYLLFEKNISIKSRIFMTATERFYKGAKDDIVSMDDFDVYGDIFAQMSFKEAIDLKLLTDYKIITIDVKKSEIAEFIIDNGLVELNNVWKKETESRSLASMLALRKAMKQFPIKNAVSFHSSIEKARRNKDIHSHITTNYGYEPIDTYTVSGKDKTSKRNDIIQEFASSEKALITNARCLTEGVDVPNIDCIVFADPKKSKIDIVQALGRALRIKEGKDWGYVILPVIYDGDTNEIDNDNFNEILSIVRGLAANDERIIEYFKDKSLPNGGQKGGGAEIFSMISETLSESDFAEQLNIRIWEKLSRFNWMPFEEARETIRKLNLKNQKDWIDYIKSKKRPNNLPAKPERIYKNSGWLSLMDWLGTAPGWNGEWEDFNKARNYVRKLGLKNQKEWNRFNKSKEKPYNIPATPRKVYLNNGWVSLGDWLGTHYEHEKEFMSFEEAREYIKSFKLKGQKDFRLWSKRNRPDNFPSRPEIEYKNKGWLSFEDFIGTKPGWNGQYLSFEEVRILIHKRKLNSKTEWQKFCLSGQKPFSIPSSPQSVYRKNWISWGDFLGTYEKAPQDKIFIKYEEASKIVIELGIKTHGEWTKFKKSKNFDEYNLPKAPEIVYDKKGWKGYPAFFGKEKIKKLRFFRAKEFMLKSNVNTWAQWVDYSKKDRPSFIPSNPQKFYKDQWKGWKDFLGTSNDKKFKSYNDAKKWAHLNKIKTKKQWKESPDRPKYYPINPDQCLEYKKDWIGWKDFLGKE